MKIPAVYIMASGRNGTLYVGVTADLLRRAWQHREGLAEGFTKKYNVKMLVWYELHETMESAISREKAMKKWRREWKLSTIERENPKWVDLWAKILGKDEDLHRHSRVCGNPESSTPFLDSRMRGNDGT